MTEAQYKARIQARIMQASALEIELIWMPAIMSKQTRDEKNKGVVCRRNGKGLNKFHVSFMTSLYDQVITGNHLSDNQADAARTILKSYWKQFVHKTVSHEPKQTTLV